MIHVAEFGIVQQAWCSNKLVTKILRQVANCVELETKPLASEPLSHNVTLPHRLKCRQKIADCISGYCNYLRNEVFSEVSYYFFIW